MTRPPEFATAAQAGPCPRARRSSPAPLPSSSRTQTPPPLPLIAISPARVRPFPRTTDGLEHDASDPTDRNFDPKQTSTISPPPQGTKFRFFNPGPRPAGWEENAQNREEFLAAGQKRHEEMGDSYEHLGTVDHPGMHKTPTIDYIMILRGNGEFNALVSRRRRFHGVWKAVKE